MKVRSCTEMLTKGNPLVLKPRSLLAGFVPYRIKGVMHPWRVEFMVVVEIFSRPRVLYRYQGPAFRASISDAVTDATWQAITSWCRRNKDELQNSIHRLLHLRKKDKFKASGVKKDVPRMDMVHH
jgi:hypothetical protein